SAAATRQSAITAALLQAAAVPLETARACARVARLAAAVAERGNTNAASDAGVAALLAEAAAKGAAYNVRINVASLAERSQGAALLDEIGRVLRETSDHARRAEAAVESSLAP
ncbi:MAG TPA: cyclodeaminase/cyclohydrolase family protein, partial [Gemmatimonadaceae bacterium]|nr:cyclodeaminase/cyclohydrolase family protein [Gemmatimonadaceae bacterium]